MNYFESLQMIYVLSVNYGNHKGEYLWLNAFSSSLKDEGFIRGKLIDLNFPPHEDFFHLVLGYLGEHDNYPIRIKTFKINRQSVNVDGHTTVRIIYDIERNDFNVMIDESSEIANAYNGDEIYFPGRDLPDISYSIDDVDILWILDGTLPSDIFGKVKNIALLLNEKMKKSVNYRAGFIVYGEYSKVWKTPNNQNFSLDAFEVKPKIPVFMSSEEFRRRLQKIEPMPSLQWDDPASAIELAIRTVIDNVEFMENKSSWIIMIGDSLPHFSISELAEQNVEIIPTEEFLNIGWKDEFEKLLATSNFNLISCWIDDKLSPKWLAVDKGGVCQEYLVSKHWWTNDLPSQFPTIRIEPFYDAHAVMQDVFEIIYRASTPRFFLGEKLRLPLRNKLFSDYP